MKLRTGRMQRTEQWIPKRWISHWECPTEQRYPGPRQRNQSVFDQLQFFLCQRWERTSLALVRFTLFWFPFSLGVSCFTTDGRDFPLHLWLKSWFVMSNLPFICNHVILLESRYILTMQKFCYKETTLAVIKNCFSATLLLRHLLVYLTSDDMIQCKAVYLHVMVNNTSAIEFYEMLSFQLHGRLSNYYSIKGDLYDGYLYVLYINGGQAPSLLWYPLWDTILCLIVR